MDSINIASWFFDSFRTPFLDHISVILKTQGKEVEGQIKLNTNGLPLQSFLTKGWDMTPINMNTHTIDYGFSIHNSVHGKMTIIRQEHHKFLKACVRYIVTVVTNHLIEDSIFMCESELDDSIWFVDKQKFNNYVSKVKNDTI